MSFSVRAVGAGSTGAGNLASTAQTLPTHASGDIILCVCCMGESGATFGFSGTGWAEHFDSPFSNATSQVHIIWKLAASSSENQPSVSWSGANSLSGRANVLACITGGSTSTYPFGPSSAVSDNASAQNAALTQSVSVAANWAACAYDFKLDDHTARSFSGANFTIGTNLANNTVTTQNDIGVCGYLGENTGAATTTGTGGVFTLTGGAAATSIGFYITIKKLNAIEETSKRALRDFNQHFLRL